MLVRVTFGGRTLAVGGFLSFNFNFISQSDILYVKGVRYRSMEILNRTEVDDLLYDSGTGVLSLQSESDDAPPYPVPLSFGYDGDALYFHSGGEGRKRQLVTERQPASFVVYNDVGDAWQSVIVTGPLSKVSAEKATDVYRVLSENAQFPPDVTTWGEPLERTPFDLYGLPVEEWSGRRFETHAVPDHVAND